MKITVVISVLLITQHFGNVRGDFPFFRPNNHLSTQTQQPVDSQLQQLTQSLQQLDQSLQHPHIPLQQPNLLQQPFPPFQQKDLLQQQSRLPFQQPFQQLQQQLYRPFQQPYTQQLQPYPPQLQTYPPQLQPYPPLQQITQHFNQQLICPEGTPTCADGRPAICTRHAITGFPVYSCFKTIPQKEFPWASGVTRMAPSSSTNLMFSGPNPLNSTGARSLLGMLHGSNSDTASLHYTSDTTNPTDHGLSANSEVGNQVLNPSLPTGLDYPCSNLLCSTCPFLLGSFAPFQTCELGQYPHLSNFPLPPLSQSGNVQPVNSTANVALPGYLAAHPYPPPYPQPGSPLGPNYSPGFQSPPYSGQGFYQSPGPIPPNQQMFHSHTVSNEPQDTGLLSMFPEFIKNIFSRSHPLSDDQQQLTQPNNPYNPMNQPIRSAPFSGGLNYPKYQQTPPFQPAWNPSIFPNPESRLPERPPLLRLLEPPGIEPPVSSYTTIPGLPQQNIPTFRGPQSHHNLLQNPLLASAVANLVHQAPRMPASMAQRVQSPVQPGYQGLNQFSSPLSPTKSQHPRDLQRTPDINQPNPNSQYLPTASNYTFDTMPQNRKSSLQADNPQNPQSLRGYLSSGLSLSLPDEEPPRGEKSIKKYDKRSSVTQHVKKTRPRKPSASSYWF